MDGNAFKQGGKATSQGLFLRGRVTQNSSTSVQPAELRNGITNQKVDLHTYWLDHRFDQGEDLLKSLGTLGEGRRLVVMSEISPDPETIRLLFGSDIEDWSQPYQNLTNRSTKSVNYALNSLAEKRDCKLVYVDDPVCFVAESLSRGAMTGLRGADSEFTLAIANIRNYLSISMIKRRSARMFENVLANTEDEGRNAVLALVAGENHIDDLREMIKSDGKMRKNDGQAKGRKYKIVPRRLPQAGQGYLVNHTMAGLPKDLGDKEKAAAMDTMTDRSMFYLYARSLNAFLKQMNRVLPVRELQQIIDYVCGRVQRLEDGKEYTTYLRLLGENPHAPAISGKVQEIQDIVNATAEKVAAIVDKLSRDEKAMEKLHRLEQAYLAGGSTSGIRFRARNKQEEH